MIIPRKKFRIKLLALLLVMTLAAPPITIFAVKPIEDMETKLEGITAEEQEVLVKLFGIRQELESNRKEEALLSRAIKQLQGDIEKLEADIEINQETYNTQLEVLEKVLINYQRGGATNYLELLISADSLASFLKSLNIIKDLSRNVGELLDELEEGKKLLEARKAELNSRVTDLSEKQEELQRNLHKSEQLEQELEEYLVALQDERQSYEEQLLALETMWNDNKVLFQNIMTEFSEIINDGGFTVEDLNLSIGFFIMRGYIKEETFNSILNTNSDLPETLFRFEEDQITIEVPEKHLVLTGNFIIAGDTTIEYVVESGTFYEILLEPESLRELFPKGPISMDLKAIAGDMITMNFTLTELKSRDGQMSFEIRPQW